MKVNYEQLFYDQTTIIHQISSGTVLPEILKYIVTSLEKSFSDEVYGSITMYDPIQKKLGNRISPSLPKSFTKSIKFMDNGLYEDSTGTAAYLKKPLIVSNIEKSPLWDKYRDTAKMFGFRACWSIPILTSKNGLLGTFDLYCKEDRGPDLHTLSVIENYSNLAAIAFQNAMKMKKKSMQEMIQSIEVKTDPKINKEKNEVMFSQLKRALKREEFEVFYQPSFCLEEADICGVEALIRWNHPNAGLLYPIDFLDVAEETGFILEMEKWVLKQAIVDMISLQKKGFENLALSVNISAQQLECDAFPSVIASILEQSSFPPEKLTLEVTERFLIKKETVNILKQLKQLGVKISIDDFGTSYSSLQYLKDLPIDELKIDRSFISNMDSDINNQKIVEMIVLLGHQLDLNVVAEGVETKKQLQLLKEMECDVVQGFLFSKPISIIDFMQKYAKKISQPVM